MSSPTINPGARPTNEASEAAAAANVQSLFNSIAPTYDRLNHLLSLGLDRRWWGRTASVFRDVLTRPEAQVLDLCCGTGDMTHALLALRPANGEPLTGLDFSSQMLARAHAKYPAANIRWVEGDAMHLPYPDASFDLITAAFGFRNLTNYAEGLRELHRVLKPGGQLGILECNQPSGLRGLGYNFYLHHMLPLVGGIVSGQREAYRYLPASIARFPRSPQMLAMLRENGYTDASWTGYFLHAAGLYRAVKA
ncbi:demethylmenaquinone methyltransferase [Bryocella elongata]|uniref:Demethylmenaquinone methyltransferase n=1 Tax=Bryocella elongata TaxID=863522 RepID=A0A1H5ZD75_9BACT|nr:bifunctional demethylmenaquinone methyltransferase/2-methoxy-6-polyprenyl-1,4-benzoquinol methylase UbiE [Bryocella elongata]SEG34010.1 demethylmenaquinone methyltransferase [Bryocella elongata]